ncbi:transposase [Methanobrevibacter olleyae]|uniref:Transposase n=3 Tax=Methanobrevibacter olleyae TaxID=294671 RepID=A0A126R0A4_METOL|nr:transposase [Methanobrevibacter olleyae]
MEHRTTLYIFPEVLKELRKRRIIREGDLILADKGYYKYDNYRIGLIDYRIIPLIFPKENMKMKKLNQIFNYKLEIFNPKKNTEKIKKLLKRLKNEFLEKINNWEKYKPIRGKIEDFFKLCKDGLNMREYTQIYT